MTWNAAHWMRKYGENAATIVFYDHPANDFTVSLLMVEHILNHLWWCISDIKLSRSCAVSKDPAFGLIMESIYGLNSCSFLKKNDVFTSLTSDAFNSSFLRFRRNLLNEGDDSLLHLRVISDANNFLEVGCWMDCEPPFRTAEWRD